MTWATGLESMPVPRYFPIVFIDCREGRRVDLVENDDPVVNDLAQQTGGGIDVACSI